MRHETIDMNEKTLSEKVKMTDCPGLLSQAEKSFHPELPFHPPLN